MLGLWIGKPIIKFHVRFITTALWLSQTLALINLIEWEDGYRVLIRLAILTWNETFRLWWNDVGLKHAAQTNRSKRGTPY